MASIALENLCKSYGGVVHAVRDVSFEIADGEFFGLLGPSGSGKTTVLRMLAGLEHPNSGSILFDGEAVEDRSPQERNIAMVFESNALYPHMSARQNISYPLKIAGLAKDQVATKVEEVAVMLNIAHLLDRRAGQMSGGQQQRVAIARALVRQPNLLCLDEPIAHLDTLLRARLRGELKRLQRSLGTTSVIVTHDPIEAMTMTDRLALMRDGMLQQVGTPDDIHNRPVNSFVAQFFGLHSINLLPMSGLRGIDTLTARLGGEGVVLPSSVKAEAATDGRLVLGARPSQVDVLKRGMTSERVDAVRFEGRVYVAEQLGDALLVTVQAGDVSLQALVPHNRNFVIDEPVEVVIPDGSLFAFDPDSHATRRFARQSAPLPPAAVGA